MGTRFSIAAAAALVGVCAGLWMSPYVRGSRQESKFEYSERPESIKFSDSMACKGVAEGYVAALPFKKEVVAEFGPGQDTMAVKVGASGLTVLTQAAVSIGTTEGTPMPIVKVDDHVVFAVEVSHTFAPMVDVMIIDKKTGTAIWSRTDLGVGLGSFGGGGHVEYLECR
jgi:hypothetical protein